LNYTNLFILGGGGILKDYGKNSRSLHNWLKILKIAVILNKKTILLCVGVDNITYDASKKFIKDLLNQVNIISVRDNYSKNLLKNIGVSSKIYVIPDPVILLSSEFKKFKVNENESKKVIICVRHWYEKGFYIQNEGLNENFINTISRFADFIIKNYNLKVMFLPMRIEQHDDDRLIAREILRRMKYQDNCILINKVPTVEEFYTFLKECKFLVGMRLHSLIFAASFGVPIIGLEYMTKIKSFMESINQEAFSYSLEKLDFSDLIKSTEKILINLEAHSKIILEHVSKLKTKSELFFDFLTKYLNNNY
ncbi:MAG: hypothetical protein GF311_03520, partial [Candidatus Lokiarchaeota archaeon]|nr:hypothetical protein [Candidatus Lokiarchaeota archaeon]